MKNYNPQEAIDALYRTYGTEEVFNHMAEEARWGVLEKAGRLFVDRGNYAYSLIKANGGITVEVAESEGSLSERREAFFAYMAYHDLQNYGRIFSKTLERIGNGATDL